jgi:hypothetical protein
MGKSVTVTHTQAPKRRDGPLRIQTNVVLLLKDAKTGRVERVVEAHNLVTNDGAQYYAERGAAQTPLYTFNLGRFALASSFKFTEAATRTLNDLVFSTLSGIKTFDSGYPKTNDTDTDNTGAGVRVVTYRRTYATTQANFTIKALAVCRAGFTTNPASSASLRKILNYLTLSVAEQITKTSSQTLKAFINHTFAGV